MCKTENRQQFKKKQKKNNVRCVYKKFVNTCSIKIVWGFSHLIDVAI